MTRTNEQNKRMWAMLADISAQVVWHGLKYEPNDWKQIFSASVERQRIVQSIDGDGVVMLGVSTRKQNKQWLSDMLMIIEVFGENHGVKFTAPDYYEDFNHA